MLSLRGTLHHLDMTDAHCHIAKGAERYWLAEGRSGCARPEWSRTRTGELARERARAHGETASARQQEGEVSWRFYGVHPWDAEEAGDFEWLKERLEADPGAGVGEIGLDRLKTREISEKMREVFRVQLEIAAAFGRAVVLHGAKCWGQVVKECQGYKGKIPAFIFHGFSRSEGLLGEIVALNGYVSVGPAVLNDHAVNYRELVRKIPAERILVESDRTEASGDEVPELEAIARKVAEVRGEEWESFKERVERNERACETRVVSHQDGLEAGVGVDGGVGGRRGPPAREQG